MECAHQRHTSPLVAPSMCLPSPFCLTPARHPHAHCRRHHRVQPRATTAPLIPFALAVDSRAVGVAPPVCLLHALVLVALGATRPASPAITTPCPPSPSWSDSAHALCRSRLAHPAPVRTAQRLINVVHLINCRWHRSRPCIHCLPAPCGLLCARPVSLVVNSGLPTPRLFQRPLQTACSNRCGSNG